MNWLNKISKIVVLNLIHREDRLIQITEHFDEYKIPYERVSAIKDEQGARGLRDTMLLVFSQAMADNLENILVFEDDAVCVEPVDIFHNTMNKVMEQLPENYDMCFLGCQPTGGFPNGFHSPNLLQVQKAFSTHAVLYSKKGIREIMGREFGYPIDNWYVDEIEPIGNCYTVHPFLFSQRKGFSDIGREVFDWGPFLQPRHIQKINEMRQR